MKHIIVIIWTLFLLAVLLSPIAEVPVPAPLEFEHSDKVVHFVLFAITGFVSAFGANFGNRLKPRMIIGMVFGLFLAVSTEFGQSLIPGRDTSLFDLLANVVGLGVGLSVYAFLHSR